MSSIFAWNMRGFNMPRKQRAVKEWIQVVKPGFGCLLETKVKVDQFEAVFKNALPGWNCLANYDHHRLGRIWFCWSATVEVTPLFKSSQLITCLVKLEDGKHCLCSCVYASNFQVDRRVLWSELAANQAMYGTQSIPWIVLGDFNEVLSSSEHSRSQDYARNLSGMIEFQTAVQNCNLVDLASVGPKFTWWNSQDGFPIGKKLDRVLVNGDWVTQFPYSYVSYEACGISDHTRSHVRLSSSSPGKRKPFK